jgi:ATP-dependent DNA helicase RecG
MSAEYKLTTEAPEKIIIEGESLQAFQKTIAGEATNQSYAVDFTKENALLIRKFLTGRTTDISLRDKRILATLAGLDDLTAEEEIGKLTWVNELTTLLNTPLTKKFGKIKTEWDLIHYLPLRYIDKTNPQKIDELEIGGWSVIVGMVVNEPEYDHRRDLVKIVVQDISGKRISATFFRQKWMAWKFKQNDEVILYGNYSEYIDQKGSRYPQITNAKIDKLGEVRGDLPMIPIYPQKAGDKSWQLQHEVSDLLNQNIWFEDPVPEVILKKYNLMTRDEAYRKIHFPENREDADRARQRIAFDEFIRLQVYFYSQKQSIEHSPGRPKINISLANTFIESLPFELTGAQKRVTEEIATDLAKDTPMYRLLQGEVGSGKSEVASFAALIAVASGYQVAFLAPTEILASQLFERIQNDFTRAGLLEKINVALMGGKQKVKEKREMLEALKSGDIKIIVGTHAIIQKGIEFDDLGLVIIDEQHKFGTEQRSTLKNNNSHGGVPDMLMMSATPIPRTTAQVMYGDMEISIIDELPPGRTPIVTTWSQNPNDAWKKVREQVEEGHQAYVVASLVEDSEKMENIESAVATYEMLSNEVFPDLSIGLLHGKLDKEEKLRVIQAFYENKVQILVATTVVEVGVNVPNATVMTILNANRFGIASLHQIRGRVGRGAFASCCYLIGEANNGEAEERLNALVASNDGFWLAEKDLEIRGEGTLFGNSQSGMSDMFVGNLREHKEILDMAKTVAPQASSSKMLNEEVEILYKEKTIGS